MQVNTVNTWRREELHNLFERSFSEILQDETGYFSTNPQLDQDTLADWFDFDEFIKYMPYGSLIEARDENQQLVGAAFIGKQHPISWLDGRKAELFIIGVLPGTQNKGLGSTLLRYCENEAKLFGADSVIVNAHSMQPQLHKFYKKNGYAKIGELKNYYANGDATFFLKKIKG